MKLEQVFSADGALATNIEGYQPRQAQVELATAFAKAIQQKELLVAEAGTGTGKTFAYLIPALLSERKVIISTGTKNLQEQLFHRDLPIVKKALASKAQTALLKGRSNYLCLFRHKQHQNHGYFNDKTILADFKKLSDWAVKTHTGDIAEVTTINEDSKAYPLVTSTIDNCLGKECPDYADCYLVKARKKAAEADLVVINHHLYFADMAVKDTGFGEIVPDSNIVVFDEAHQIPDIACEYFGEKFSTRQLVELAKDIELAYKTEVKDAKQLGKASEMLDASAKQFRLEFPLEAEKGNWLKQAKTNKCDTSLAALNQAMDFAYEVLKQNLSRCKSIDACFERLVIIKTSYTRVNDFSQQDASLWYETTARHASLNLTPLSIADKFSKLREEKNQSWLMTSATLSVNNSFEHYTKLLGLTEYQSLELGSPFNYPEQSVLCIPRYLPEPQDRNVIKVLVETAVKLMTASQGNCFFLFTSYRVMNLVAKSLRTKLDFPILVQGEIPKQKILDKYLAEDNSILLATGSFWEGIDVRGDALKCVMIDKLPFASPDDPLTQARIENCRKKGEDPFNQIQIPQAVITLKQGAGRLIRDVKDKGVLVICDPRVVNRNYGQVFVQSLPNMKRTRDINLACDFLKQQVKNKS
ncbi:ATP-dependent DNA helicase [Catenovulum maritimum]|uniref:ATP-dependent DNA helicase YoaA n=1 Tax=Catenovulum maritimum TaxID=1513271 RepID=A0A0J8GUZ1_9ALTE|nr:ATP-dependent DNA helicase [Catenovulum maritimum]KMT66547.1 ATP-dependent helicase [Catenovulum maritimum]